MIQKLKSPKVTRTVKDAYVEYAEQVLKDNPEFWSKYNHKTPHYQVFKRGVNKVIEVISYPRYRTIVEKWFSGAAKYIINGEALTLGNRLGRIAPRTVERNFKNKQIDWKATKAMWLKKGERKGLVYFIDDEWSRIGWKKTGKLKNSFLYRFSPAEGNTKNQTGFKLEFSRANTADPFLKDKYEFFPYIKDIEQ